MPKDKESVVLSVRLYSNSNALPNNSLSSNSLFTKSFGFIKRADSQASFATVTNSSQQHGVASKCPADPSLLGDYLGEYSAKIPSDQAFAKVELDFPVATGKNSSAKLLLSAGIFFDTRYVPMTVLLN